MKNKKTKGFTLIELLIVIAIIAVLSVVVILSLNPAELLRQARDSNRVSDMATLKSAISLYLADVTSPSLGTAATCFVTIATGTFGVPNAGGTYANNSTTCTAWMPSATTINNSTTRGINGGGWIPVNFSAISSGAPIGQEPVDPVNNGNSGNTNCNAASSSVSLSSCGLFYSYEASSTNFKLGAQMESKKYSNGGGSDVETPDGGVNNYMYEQGTLLSI